MNIIRTDAKQARKEGVKYVENRNGKYCVINPNLAKCAEVLASYDTEEEAENYLIDCYFDGVVDLSFRS